jgi:hypothetical protein
VADSSVAITAGSGTPIRVLTALGAGSAGQQVITPAGYDGSIVQGALTVVTQTAAAATAVTLTLAAPGAGLSHYIASVVFQKGQTTAGTAAAQSQVSTATNHAIVSMVPSDAQALGTVQTFFSFAPPMPVKSAAANTATVFTLPAMTGAIGRIIVAYYIAP